MKINEETRQKTAEYAIKCGSTGNIRIDTGHFYTDEEIARLREETSLDKFPKPPNKLFKKV